MGQRQRWIAERNNIYNMNYHLSKTCRHFLAGILGVLILTFGVYSTLGVGSQGYKTCLFIRVNFPNAPYTGEPMTISDAHTLMIQVNQWYVQHSYNTLSIVSDFTPVVTMPQTTSYYTADSYGNSLLQDATNRAYTVAGYNAANYDFCIVRLADIGFSWANNTPNIGQPGNLLQFPELVHAVHEMGHSMGLYHDDCWLAQNDSIIGAASTGLVDYGNPFSIMGSGYTASDTFNYTFSAFNVYSLNWLSDLSVTNITSSGVYRLYAYDVSTITSTNLYALQINKDQERTYFLEFHQAITNNIWVTNGIVVTWAPWSSTGQGGSSGSVTLFDTTPGTPNQFNTLGAIPATLTSSCGDAALVVGRTYADVGAGLYITPVNIGLDGTNKWIDVQVNLGAFASNHPPTNNITASSTNVNTGDVVTFNATASDPDAGDTLAYYWDFGDFNFGTNGPAASKSWGTAGQYIVQCTVSDMKGGICRTSVVIQVGSRTHWISGQIANDLGQPVAGVRVHNGQTGASYRGVYSDSNGGYILANVSGSVTVSAVKDGYSLSPSGFSNPVDVSTSDASGKNWVANRLPVISVTATDASAFQSPNSDTGTFQISRTGVINTSVTVSFDWVGTNEFGSSLYYFYYGISPNIGQFASVTLPANVTSANYVVTVRPTVTDQGPLSTYVVLQPGTTYSLTNNAQDHVNFYLSATATNNVSVNISSPTLLKSGPSSCGVVFSRSGSVSNSINVTFSYSGTAVNGTDYSPSIAGTSITIPAGQHAAELIIRALGNNIGAGDKTLTITVVATSGVYDLDSPSTGTITIKDINPPPQVVYATNQAVTISIPITGQNGIKKTGTNTLTLSGINTYTGSTLVSTGKLLVTGSIASGSAVTVSSGATLGGTGTVGGTVALSGIISPGASVGTLTTGSETWNGGGSYTWEINNATGTAGASSGWDLLNITGNLDVEATPSNPFTIQVVSLTGSSSGSAINFSTGLDYTWTIATVTSGSILHFDPAKFVIDTSQFLNGLGNGKFSIQQSGTSMQMVFTHTGTIGLTTKGNETISGDMYMYFTNPFGLSHVVATVLNNCTISGTAFGASAGAGTSIGTVTTSSKDLTTYLNPTYRLQLIAHKQNSSLSATVNAQASDVNGGSASFDPVVTLLEARSAGAVRETFYNLPAAEHYVRVQNGSPGLQWLCMVVNGRLFVVNPIGDQADIMVDVGMAMIPGDNNTVILVAQGVSGASGLVMIGDSPVGKPLQVSEITGSAAIPWNDLIAGAEEINGVVIAIAREGNQLALSWPASLIGFKLQGRNSLSITDKWVDVSNTPEVVMGRFKVTMTADTQMTFYRLYKP